MMSGFLLNEPYCDHFPLDLTSTLNFSLKCGGNDIILEDNLHIGITDISS